MKYVIIDAGHNEFTAGKRSPDSSLKEWEFNRDVARRLALLLTTRGFKTKVIFTAYTDSSKDVNERVKMANAEKADILVSIHANAAGEAGWYRGEDDFTWNTANGWEIFCYKPQNKGEGYKLAEAIHDASIPFLGLKDRGIKDGSHLGMVARTNMPAVLIEHAFYTNEKECALLKTTEFREKCAEAAAKGICDYFGVDVDDAKTSYRQAVKDRFGFTDGTMDYLGNYKYADDLLKKLATKG